MGKIGSMPSHFHTIVDLKNYHFLHSIRVLIQIFVFSLLSYMKGEMVMNSVLKS